MAKEKSPNEIEADLRKAAERFADAIEAARATGFSVGWPGNGTALRALEIGATGAIAASGEQAADLATVPPAEAERAAAAGPATAKAIETRS